MVRLSETQKMRVRTLLENGCSMEAVVNDLHVSKTCIFKIKQKIGNGIDLVYVHCGGGRKISTLEDDILLVNWIQRNPFETAVQAANETNFPGSISVARQRIRDFGIQNYSASKKIGLQPQHKHDRLNFAYQYVHEHAAFWQRVVFSDKKIFQSSHDGPVRVYRPANTRCEERYIKPTHRSDRFSVHISAWISCLTPGVYWNVEGRLTGNHYRDLLENIMLPSVTELFGHNFIFQHDNSPIQTSNIVCQWLATNNINTLPWPSKSPDLNPIENVWGQITKRLYRNNFRAANPNELWGRIEEAWEELTPDYTRTLVMSMQNRLQQVIDANGAWTKY